MRHIRTKVFSATQDEMAAIAGVSRPRISRYETEADRPPFEVMARIRAAARMVDPGFTAELFFESPEAVA